VIGIPFVILFMLGLRIISSNVKSFNTTTKLSLLGVWIIALLGLAFTGINFATQKAYDGVFSQTEELYIVENDTLNVKMVGNEELSNRSELRRSYYGENVYDGDDQKLYSTRIDVDIKQTDKLNAYVKIRKESEGKSRQNANSAAESIEYQFSLNDNNLALNGYFLSDLKSTIKDQLIDITIYLPVNSIVYLDRSTLTFLDDVDNIQNIHDRDMPRHYYKMTENGLECLDCDPSLFSERYKRENNLFNLSIDENGVKIKVKDGENDAEIKIDGEGIKIE
jgi:hypothetical protein